MHRTIVTLYVEAPLDSKEACTPDLLEQLLARWRNRVGFDQVTARRDYGSVFRVAVHLSDSATEGLREQYNRLRLSKEASEAPFLRRSRTCNLNEMFS